MLTESSKECESLHDSWHVYWNGYFGEKRQQQLRHRTVCSCMDRQEEARAHWFGEWCEQLVGVWRRLLSSTNVEQPLHCAELCVERRNVLRLQFCLEEESGHWKEQPEQP